MNLTKELLILPGKYDFKYHYYEHEIEKQSGTMKWQTSKPRDRYGYEIEAVFIKDTNTLEIFVKEKDFDESREDWVQYKHLEFKNVKTISKLQSIIYKIMKDPDKFFD